MRIGIDISQTAFGNTGVANYIEDLVENLLKLDHENEYVLFFASLRKSPSTHFLKNRVDGAKVKIVRSKIPLSLLSILWNTLHIMPIEWMIGKVDIFISSDWVEPPTMMAKKVTILYDLIVEKFPEETDKKIISTQKRKLYWVKKEVDTILCISQSTKNDAIKILGFPAERIKVVYPGFTL